MGAFVHVLPSAIHLSMVAGDTMLRAIRDFFVIGHILRANMNEWVEVVAAEAERASDGHVRLGHLGQ